MSFTGNFWQRAGRRQVVSIRSGVVKHADVADGAQADALAAALSPEGADAYFAPAVYRPGTTDRKASSVASCAALWADIDCGPTKPYPNIQNALAALTQWLGASKLPKPSDIVSSGSGLHVYWRLTESLTPDIWLPLAQALKARLAADGLHADPTRTADIASILRIPGTVNHKHGKPVTLLLTRDAVTVESVSAVLKPAPTTPARVQQDEHLLAWTGPQGDEAIVRSKCAQIGHVHNARGAVSEPLWRAALSVVSRCVGGDDLIHDYSRGDVRYTRADTVRKAELTAGPQSCAQFKSHRPEGCDGCPHAGKVTSPIGLGVAAAIVDAAPWGASTKGRFVIGAKGIWISGAGDDDLPKPVYHIPIWAAGIGKDADDRAEERSASLLLRYIDERRVPRSCTLPFHALVSTTKLAEWMASRGLTPSTNLKGLHMYLSQITTECATDQDAVKLYKTAGWHADAFVVGEVAYTPAGPVKAVSRSSHRDADSLGPTGSLDAWKTAVNSLAPDNHAMKACLLFSLGAPFLNFSEDKNSAVIAMTGTRPGSGKTLSAELALSVYGSPSNMMVQGSFTDASLNDSLRGLKNLPFCLDETSTIHPKRLQDIVYHAVGGKEKGRSSKSLRTETNGTWRMPVFVTSNKSFMEQDEALFNEAVRSRILEIHYENNVVDEGQGEYLHRAAVRNAGTAAPVMLDWIARNQSKLPGLFNECAKRVSKMQDGIPQRARFGKWALAAGLAGGVVAKMLGLIDWNPMDTIQAMAIILKTQHGEIRDEHSRVSEAVADFVSEHNAEISRWDSYGVCTLVHGGETLKSPTGRKTKLGTYVQVSKLRTHLRDQGVSFSAFRAWIESRNYAFTAPPTSLVPGAPQVRCYFLPNALIPPCEDTHQ